MNTVLVDEDFAKVFCELLKKANTSGYEIAKFSHLDEGYVSRLKRGIKCNPSIKVLLRISFALVHASKKIELYDIKRLFESAGLFFPINL